MKKLTKRDYDGARNKLAKAGMTARQLDALEDMVINDAVRWAESEATSATIGSKKMRTTRIVGSGSLLSFAGARRAREAIRVAVYWFHERHNHMQSMREDQHYEVNDAINLPSTWRPQA